MYINPYDDRVQIYVELSDNYDMTDLEDYIVESCKDKRVSILVKSDTTKDQVTSFERLKQLCKVKFYDMYNGEELDYFVSCKEDYKDVCYVVSSHLYIDENGNVYPCETIKEKAEKPLTNIKEWLDNNKQLKTKIADMSKEDAEVRSNKIIEMISESNKKINDYMTEHVGKDKKYCVNCKDHYKNFNKLLYVFNKLNNKFEI